MKRIILAILSFVLGSSLFANHWTPNPYDYPTNMNVIATIEINGIEQTTTSLEIGAFCGDECRGSQMLDYYEVLDRCLIFMTLYGSSGHTFTFKLYDHETQQELDLDCDQTISFSSDAIIGAIDNPYVFSFTGGTSYIITTAASPEVGGTATGGGSFMMGETCTLLATANPGYNFTDWKENGVTVSTESEYRFAVTSSRMLTACFERTSYTIDAVAMPEAAGTVTGMGTYYENETCTLSATPNEHYSFVNWTENGAVVSTESNYTFTVNANRFLTANFLINSYEITAESQPAEGGSITGAGQYEYGSVATLSAIPNGTRFFIDWKENGEVVSTEPDYSFQVTGNRHLVASFTDPYYEVEARVDPEEGGYVEGAGSYMEGSTCHLVATAAMGYTFINWTEDGEEVSTEIDYGFTVTSNRSLTANFLINTYEITAESEPTEGGFILGTGEFHYGEIATLRAYSNDTYYFINWTENGDVVSTQSDYSFQVTGDRHLVATFAQSCYVIEVDVEPREGGEVFGAGNYIEGTTCRLEAQAALGYVFLCWTDNGEEISYEPELSFVVESDRHLVANFKIRYYDIQLFADPEEGGEVYGSGSFTLGEMVYIKAIPNENYFFINWTEDGHEVSQSPTYEFEVRGDRTLVAHFYYFDGVSENEKTWSVYPNPTEGMVRIQGLPQSVVRIFDANGKLLFSGTISEGQSLDLSSYPSGCYLLDIQSAEGSHWQKVIKR
jgi:hypothetical protein